MFSLERELGKMFRAPVQRKPDTHRKARETAKKLAASASVEIEPLRGGGFNVWPPSGLMDDPYDGDHYCNEWPEVLERVERYAR